ncbi:fluoride efflux transporter CrcB [Oscillatoria amoena NRMC-F 0135]|nr:fluoride efflux transporter CrcB [Oscillatoria amoena NRMC-F 0135]
MPAFLQVIIGGALGAVSRYGLGQLFPVHGGMSFPWPTFFVNLAGCLLIGLAMGSASANAVMRQYWPLLVIGFLGGFTTFSSFGLDTIQLLQNKQWGLTVYYVLGTNIAGLLLVYVGYQLTQL